MEVNSVSMATHRTFNDQTFIVGAEKMLLLVYFAWSWSNFICPPNLSTFVSENITFDLYVTTTGVFLILLKRHVKTFTLAKI